MIGSKLARACRTLLVLAVLVPAFQGDDTRAQSDDGNLVAAINQAGRQRMLTQRILLSYCQVGLGIETSQSQSRLLAAVDLYEEQLAYLEGIAPTASIREALGAVRNTWAPFKDVALSTPDREGAGRLLYWNDDLLYASNKVVQLLQDVSGRPYARLVNIAGRQRMLSQRAAKFYMLREWGFDTLTIRDEMDSAINEFAGGLASLRLAPQNTPEIMAELDAVEVDWAWFHNALSLQGDETFRLVVTDSSEMILLRLERIAELYEHLSS